ncbi:beta-ketoacyl synthase domain-containing protein [Colletotrichum nymphaeae SA-01]|uniref:Beta-ketoacyl synthase domain-containing protein n=1 Tax=Colletotrichum nymphaeae SA-01 TaxID=1460502 RepID=A0A135T8V3_9PEZI|nr:beta-ketoacyl synthase domain-containing protein [Colletotrichum nymphaeae SA-01]
MSPNEPIVVIGSACRFPGGVDSPAKLWELLKEPKDLQSEVPKERFNIDAFYHPDDSHHGRTNARHGYFLDETPRAFDASFFNIQAGEAESIDPQQRLLLETTYDAVAAAGYGLHDLRGSDTAVYVGLMTHDFELVKVNDISYSPTYFATGAATSIASNRLSYFFDWHGPSFLSSCGASCGATTEERIEQDSYSSWLEFDLVSKSRMWDAAADGYARGEGVATVVLKTLSQALLDGDSIECVIRETGINQDGRTTGITMPSHVAQETLIRETYARAGLDVAQAENRCQFFEAHGTGTPAGDPQEAEAISKAFFGSQDSSDSERLLVGSLKTVIGHTEGTAGIAGLLKASLAVQNGVIPPNLLFENLSPKVAPFYKNLSITKEAQPWPELKPGQPRRASVNSFGFGGTNAHAIIEEYKTSASSTETTSKPESQITSAAYALPLVLSAKSERSLKSLMKQTAQFIKSNPDVDMLDLFWTLLCKRSILPYRQTVVGSSREAIILALENAISENASSEPTLRSFTTSQEKPRLLGVFTGQGAQWPGMMRSLISAIPQVRDIVVELDRSLQTLPVEYRPSWTLHEQFLLEDEASNVTKASFSQPLCCAVQIVLVRLLAAAGVEFTTIVGHSSGEIACAFAGGFISASQAIRIAYLRGLTSKYASSRTGEREACLRTTISGDADALAELQTILEDESKFVRMLKVDKAYHSHHMLSCSPHYIKALEDCGCDVADGVGSSVAWYSSVHQNRRMKASDITAEYWNENLVSSVRFMQAIEAAAIEHKSLDAAIEVGCHPALKAPCLATLKTVLSEEIPYTGCMQRGSDNVQAFASAVGYLWERLGLNAVDPDSFIAKVIAPGNSLRSLSKALPRYPWDHSRTHWNETRAIKAHLYGEKPHLLLGSLSASSTGSTSQWHNTIRPRDHEWLQGHALQGQAVFPAAGYIVMAMEAALQMAGGRSVQLLEVLDMSIDKAVTFEDKNSPAELIVAVDTIVSQPDQIKLGFTIDSCLAKETKPSTSATGQLVVTFGDSSTNVLPPANDDPPHLTTVNIKNFYRELDELGFDYSKDYRCIYNLARADAKATGHMAFPRLDDGSRPIVLHPASMDLAFQTIMGAYSAPGDKRLRSIYVPVHIDRISLVPSLCASVAESDSAPIVHFNTANTYDKGDVLAGDATVFSSDDDKQVLYRIENLLLQPLSKPSEAEDHKAFTKTVWGPLKPEALLDNPDLWATEQDKQVIPIIERICYFYMKEFVSQLTEEDRANATMPHQRYIYWNEHVSAKVKEGTWHEWYDPSWESDTREQIEQLVVENSYHPHVKMAKRVSENTLSTIREKSNPFLWMDHDGLLTEFYTSYLTSGPGWLYGQELVSQLCHRYQTMDILEIGGGTASATKYILDIPQLGFNSYTFTDISPAFFEKAQEHFSAHEDRMIFQKLDITKKPEEQGFKPHSYDMIIASSVLHATPKLAETMANVRSLLKPGGHVVLLEATHRDHTRVGYLFGLFPDWWAGIDEGRDLDPFADINQWDAIFKQTGFSGVDTRTLDRHGNLFPNTLFCTHAVNTKVARLDAPLSAPPTDRALPQIVVIGGGSSKSARLLDEVRQTLPGREIVSLKRIEDVLESSIPPKSTFLVLSELDYETFSGIDEVRFSAIKSLLELAGTILWLTENAWIENPYQAMTAGMLRSARLEYPATHNQSLDVDDAEKLDTNFLVQQLLRLEEPTDSKEDILWTLEPEVYVSKSRAYIPRIKHDIQRNNRLNSKRRAITASVDSHTTPVTLLASEDTLYLESSETFGEDSSVEADLEVKVDFSLGNAIRVGDLGFWHLVQGTIVGTDKKVMALSATNASIVHVHSSHAFVVPASEGVAENASVLLSTAARLVAQRIFNGIASGASVLVMEPPSFCVDAIIETGKSRNVQVHLATAGAPVSSSLPWIRLHSLETDAGIRKALPVSLSVYYDFSEGASSITSLGSRVAKLLPPVCLKFDRGHIFQSSAESISSFEQDAVQRPLVEQAVLAAAAEVPKSAASPEADEESSVKPVGSIIDLKDALATSTIIDWRTESRVTARVRAVDSGKLFSLDKTYLLLGLAGSLGRSLARWLITHGARHVVISSRNPETPDPKWLAEIENLGGIITVLSIDVSKEASIDAGLTQIRRTLPPIGGIAYGPLVLHDALLASMDLSMMNVPVNSKVVGAQILHERFSNQAKDPLDFFVMFSSVATVGGNPGQANYTAANSFLQALAQKRHIQGLPASTIAIGAVIGVGFLSRTGREEEFKLASDTDTISEDEFLTLFAEAVVSGRRAPGPQPVAITDISDLEVITGIPEFSARHKDTVKFYDDPRFGNLKVPESRANTDGASGAKSSVKEQLLKARTLDEVRDIIIDGLSQKMRGILHIPADEKVNATTPLIDQGVDSLGAITVGSWFSKTLMIDIPLLRVVSGASIAELAEEAAGRLSRAAIPLIESADGIVSSEDDSRSGSDSPIETSNATSISDLRGEEAVLDDKTATSRQIPLSLTQEHSWKLLQQLSNEPTIFHNTIGVFMKGSVDLDRLEKALNKTLRRHEIFRTAFSPEGEQVILPNPVTRVRYVEVSDRAAAEEAYKQLENEEYDLAAGEGLKIVDFYWGQDEHLFVIGYHRLVGDGSTTQNFLDEVGQLYDGAQLSAPPQYSNFAARQRSDVQSGQMDADIAYWTSMYKTLPGVLPVLSLPNAQKQRDASDRVAWKQHVGTLRLSAILAFRIRERCKKLKGVTPMHFYLAAYHLLLARLSAAEDVAIGIADTNRASIQDVSTMGFFANLLPVRLAPFEPAQTFADELESVKERLRQAMQHARVPYGVTLDRLGLASSSAELPHAPLFQAVFDYRQGAAETGRLGGASFTEIWASRERTPHDVVLEMSDDPAKEPLVTVKLQSYLYGEEDPKAFLSAYEATLTSFSENTKLAVAQD